MPHAAPMHSAVSVNKASVRVTSCSTECWPAANLLIPCFYVMLFAVQFIVKPSVVVELRFLYVLKEYLCGNITVDFDDNLISNECLTCYRTF